MSGLWLRSQPVDATHWLNRSAGVAKFNVFLGFPLAMFFAWAFELTPDGLKKEKDVDHSKSITPNTGRKLDFTIIGFRVQALVTDQLSASLCCRDRDYRQID